MTNGMLHAQLFITMSPFKANKTPCCVSVLKNRKRQETPHISIKMSSI